MHTSLRELAGEGVTELVDVDGRFLGTLRTLLAHPGRLTAEYLAGRRTRYVRPVRLYLTLSVLYFLALSLTGGASDARARATARGDSTQTVAGIQLASTTDSARNAIREAARELEVSTTDQTVERAVKHRLLRLAAMSPEEQRSALVGGLVAHLPKAFFVLVPLFALLLRVLYRRRAVYYAEHLIFALHVHAFAFLLFAVREVVGGGPVIDALLAAWLLPYIVVALRRTHHQSWLRTSAKAALLLPAYSALVTLAMLLVVVTTVALL